MNTEPKPGKAKFVEQTRQLPNNNQFDEIHKICKPHTFQRA